MSKNNLNILRYVYSLKKIFWARAFSLPSPVKGTAFCSSFHWSWRAGQNLKFEVQKLHSRVSRVTKCKNNGQILYEIGEVGICPFWRQCMWHVCMFTAWPKRLFGILGNHSLGGIITWNAVSLSSNSLGIWQIRIIWYIRIRISICTLYALLYM